MGDSTVVVGDESTIKVHVHVSDPGRPLSYGISLGHISDVVVENMQAQMEDIIQAAPPAAMAVVAPDVQPNQVAVVAVAAGAGLAGVFRSLGAAGVVNGGQTNNPSTEEIFRAIDELPTDKIIVLPNNKNIILAAEAARDLSSKQVTVVPSRSAPQGIAALMSLNPDRDLASNAEAMTRSLSLVKTGEITRATRSVQLDGVDVAEGALIGLADGKLCCSGTDELAVLSDLLEHLEAANCGLVTLYYGATVTLAQAADVAEHVRARYPDLEVEVIEGGQPHYDYVLGAE